MERSGQAAESGSSSGQEPLCLVKVGGSLLDLPDLAARLRELLSQLDGPAALLIGGGAAADAVREWAATFELDESTAHWLAVDSLSLTARLVCSLLNRDADARTDVRRALSSVEDRSELDGQECPSYAKTGESGPAAQVVTSWAEACRALGRGEIPLLEARGLLVSVDEQPGLRLPESWAATSDSIAAAVAIRWNVPQLVLVKSVAKPADGLLAADAWSTAGERPVDDWFRELAPRLPTVLWCNLREAPIRCDVWSPLGATGFSQRGRGGGESQTAEK